MQTVDKAKWKWMDGYAELQVTDDKGRINKMLLEPRPVYCDRGHWMVTADTYCGIDHADGFPKYFFTLDEADKHVRMFLKWRIWKRRLDVYEDLERWCAEGD